MGLIKTEPGEWVLPLVACNLLGAMTFEWPPGGAWRTCKERWKNDLLPIGARDPKFGVWEVVHEWSPTTPYFVGSEPI